jgi:hypothetical protein
MDSVENAASYRICAVSDHRWDVLRGSSTEPVASFSAKDAAVAYAMSLARASWQLPLGGRHDALEKLFARQSRETRGRRL